MRPGTPIILRCEKSCARLFAAASARKRRFKFMVWCDKVLPVCSLRGLWGETDKMKIERQEDEEMLVNKH